MLPAVTAGLIHRLSAACGLYRSLSEGMVAAELSAMLAGFEPVLAELEEARSTPFPQLCGEETLCRWERLTGLAGRPDIPEQLRRSRVCAMLSVRPTDFTPEGVQRSLAAAGLTAEVSEIFAEGQIEVDISAFTDPGYPAAETVERAALLLPAHLQAVFHYASLTWTEWEQRFPDWQSYDSSGYTWQQLDIMTDEEGEI